LGSHESLLFNQGFNLPTDHNRFETAKRGYDPEAVERELNALNSELVRVKEQATENAEALQRTLAQLAQSEAKLSGTIAPSFSSLGAEAAELLIRAETTAREIESAAAVTSEELIESATQEAKRIEQNAENVYQDQITAAERRAARRIAGAKHDAELLIMKATTDAKDKVRDAELEVARMRGQAATEVAALKTTAKREVEAKKAELDAKIAGQEVLNLDQLGIEQAAKDLALADLESKFKTRRRVAEKEYLEKHNEAVHQTETYLESAKVDLTDLKKTISTIRLEIQALEMEAGQAQSRILAEARSQAEAIVHASDLEATEINAKALESIAELEKASELRMKKIENRVRSGELYLKNLRSLVTNTDSPEE
jgi:cell division septum initiation protein DivIVA